MCAAMDYEAVLDLSEAAVLVSMPLASEIGFRVGKRLRDRKDEAITTQVSVVQATTFAILGLLVAFAVSMAETRFSVRRALILDEANAIGTTYLRSKYLLDPHPAELAPLFRRYVDARLDFYASRHDVPAIRRAIATGDELQREIWAHAITVAREDPSHGDTNAVFIVSLNEMIDLEDARVAALFTHVPATVIGLVVLVGILASITTGYAAGLGGRRTVLSVTMLPILVGVAVCVVLDLDSPRLGLITTGQLPMERLAESLAEDASSAGALAP